MLVLTLCCFFRFILRGDLVILVFFSPFSIAITSLGEERGTFSVFRTYVRFAFVWFSLGVWEGLRFAIVALPGQKARAKGLDLNKSKPISLIKTQKMNGRFLPLLLGAIEFLQL